MFNSIRNNMGTVLISPTFGLECCLHIFGAKFSQAKIKIANEPCNGISHPFYRIKCAKYFSQILSFDISICVSQKTNTHTHPHIRMEKHSTVKCWAIFRMLMPNGKSFECLSVCMWFLWNKKNDSFPLVKRKMHVMMFNPWENESKWSHIHFGALGPPPEAKSPSIH